MRFWVLAALLASFTASANWTLDSDTASLHFISTKNDNIAEIHTFDQINGKVDGNTLTVSIPLSSLNTLIPIRNERMQKMLFDMANHPHVTFTAAIDATLLNQAVGGATQTDIKGQLNISGNVVPTTFSVSVARLSEDKISVATTKPTVLTTASFKLNDGVEALRNVAMLKVISQAVPVNFNVSFTK